MASRSNRIPKIQTPAAPPEPVTAVTLEKSVYWLLRTRMLEVVAAQRRALEANQDASRVLADCVKLMREIGLEPSANYDFDDTTCSFRRRV